MLFLCYTAQVTGSTSARPLGTDGADELIEGYGGAGRGRESVGRLPCTRVGRGRESFSSSGLPERLWVHSAQGPVLSGFQLPTS